MRTSSCLLRAAVWPLQCHLQDDSGAEASRRLSLGQLFNKGLVSGARGMWEQKIGKYSFTRPQQVPKKKRRDHSTASQLWALVVSLRRRQDQRH